MYAKYIRVFFPKDSVFMCIKLFFLTFIGLQVKL